MEMKDQAIYSNSRVRICNYIFVAKAFLAVVLGTTALGFNAFQVITYYNKAIKPLQPVFFPPVGSAGAAACFTAASQSRLEPPAGELLWGFSPHWLIPDGSLPADVLARLGGSNAATVWNTFIHTDGNPTNFSQGILEWNVQLVQKVGGILELSLQPDVKADQIQDAFYTNLALFLRRMNSQYGVPILLRFMAEMNGNWMPYGMSPTTQIAAWRKLSAAVRAQTNMTALLWSPNIGGGYPFRNGGYDFAIPTSGADLTALDTNRNGQVDAGDDPYAPYYPGDDIVDWVGISLYNFERRNGQAVVASPTVFTDPASQESLFSTTFPFYSAYVSSKRKPFIFSETGSAVDYNYQTATIVPSPPTVAIEVETKRSWWNAILSSARSDLPGLKAAVWFEEFKDEASYQDSTQRVMRDYRISYNSSVIDAFNQDIAGAVTKPGRFKFDCSGKFTFQ